MRRAVDQCPADIVLAPSGCPFTDLEYADNAVIFAESSTKLQRVVNLVSKLAAAHGPRPRPDKCKKPAGRKREFWTEVAKEDLRILGVDMNMEQRQDGLILCKLSQKIEKVGQSYVQGRHSSVKMRVIASSDEICLAD
ncbi:hypothetical protein RB195_009620 [Necator americanus]